MLRFVTQHDDVTHTHLIVAFVWFGSSKPDLVFAELTCDVRDDLTHVQSFSGPIVSPATSDTSAIEEGALRRASILRHANGIYRSNIDTSNCTTPASKSRLARVTSLRRHHDVLKLACLCRLEHQSQLFAQTL